VEAARGVDRIVLTLGDTEQSSREGWADNHLGDRPASIWWASSRNCSMR
jgi:beta-glucosidase